MQIVILSFFKNLVVKVFSEGVQPDNNGVGQLQDKTRVQECPPSKVCATLVPGG